MHEIAFKAGPNLRSVHHLDDRGNLIKQELRIGDNSKDIPNPMLKNGGGDSPGKTTSKNVEARMAKIAEVSAALGAAGFKNDQSRDSDGKWSTSGGTSASEPKKYGSMREREKDLAALKKDLASAKKLSTMFGGKMSKDIISALEKDIKQLETELANPNKTYKSDTDAAREAKKGVRKLNKKLAKTKFNW